MTRILKLKTALAVIISLCPLQSSQNLAQDLVDIVGTYKLISSTRKILETGEVLDTYGENPNGYIMYGEDGRMLALVTRSDREAPSSLASLDDDTRADLFRSMLSYGGTYNIAGNKIEHHIDISSNELWNGTVVVRNISRKNGYLVYTTEPAPFSGDGKLSVTTLTWIKLG